MHNHRRRRFVLVAIATVAITIPLLSLFVPAPAKQDADKAKDLVRITATEFFSGELNRLKSHVDFQGYCFKIRTHGSLCCWPSIEMWCDGKEVERPGSGHGFVTYRDSDEISLSYRQLEGMDGTTQYSVYLGGILVDGRLMDEPKSKQEFDALFGPTAIRAPVELKAEGESVIVWAKGAGRGIDLSNPAEAEKKLKAAPWALVLRVYAEKEK